MDCYKAFAKTAMEWMFEDGKAQGAMDYGTDEVGALKDRAPNHKTVFVLGATPTSYVLAECPRPRFRGPKGEESFFNAWPYSHGDSH